MRKLIYNMMYRILGILPGVLAVAFATAQKPVEHITVDQCIVLDIGVQEFPGDRYIWDLYTDPGVNFATEDGDVDKDTYFEGGNNVGSRVRIHKLPAGEYFLRVMVWDDNTCTNNLLVFQLTIEPVMHEVEVIAGQFCYGEYNEVRITFTGRGPWDLAYTWDDETGTQIVKLNGIVDPIYYLPIPLLDPGKHSLWIMEVKDESCDINTYEVPIETELIIHARPRTSNIYIKPDEENEEN